MAMLNNQMVSQKYTQRITTGGPPYSECQQDWVCRKDMECGSNQVLSSETCDEKQQKCEGFQWKGTLNQKKSCGSAEQTIDECFHSPNNKKTDKNNDNNNDKNDAYIYNLDPLDS